MFIVSCSRCFQSDFSSITYTGKREQFFPVEVIVKKTYTVCALFTLGQLHVYTLVVIAVKLKTKGLQVKLKVRFYTTDTAYTS